MVIYLFKEVKNMGFIGRDIVWIIIDFIVSLFDFLNLFFILYMEGIFGIKSYYDEYI